MLEKPELQEEEIVSCVENNYELEIEKLTFLPLGADSNSAVYRVDSTNQTAHFLKLRSGIWDRASVGYPRLLSDSGILPIIPPSPTVSGALQASVGAFKTILYPFVEGQNGYEVRLTNDHWNEFGSTLKSMHEIEVPLSIAEHIRTEDYSPRWRESLQESLTSVEAEGGHAVVEEPIAQEAAAFLRTKRDEILDLVARAEKLTEPLQAQPQEFIVCHADLHAGNVLIDNNGTFYLVDWDTLVLAPKERDLMYVGGALMAGHRLPEEEERLFYAGYGETQINPVALAYYRFERIIEDLAIYCKELLFTDAGGDDRPQGLHSLKSNFMPGRTIEMAHRAAIEI